MQRLPKIFDEVGVRIAVGGVDALEVEVEAVVALGKVYATMLCSAFARV
jgi:hypothetical protein